MRSRVQRFGLGLAIVLASACGGESGEAPPPAESTPAASEPAAAQEASPSTSSTPAPSGAPAAPSAPATLEVPASYRIQFETSKGNFVVQVDRSSAPNGADRFFRLVTEGFYDDVRFFRVLSGFMAQFGINGDPEVTARWRAQPIQDDPVVGSNSRGTITFAKTNQANSRTSQVFINLVDNANLDGMGFAPFGRVVEGMDVVDQLYAGYGEGAPQGNGPAQGQIVSQGNAYLTQSFPLLDHVVRARVVN
ncbi:MAG: peptidylprolyl isomerase [Gemmatimonadetes bacterium]|nr:peptidylprolyl isomerase [Gemmatimonadota bacterium]